MKSGRWPQITLAVVCVLCACGTAQTPPGISPSATHELESQQSPAATVARTADPTESPLRPTLRIPGGAAPEPRAPWYDLALAAITTFVAAMAATLIAVALEALRARREKREEEIRQLRRLQFALAERAMILREIWAQWLGPPKEFVVGGLWAALQSHAGAVEAEPLSLENVAFLLGGDDPNLLARLHLLKRKYQSFIATANLYSEKRSEAARRFEERTEGAEEPESVSWDEVGEKIAGHRLHRELHALAASLYAREPLGGEVELRFEEVGAYIVRKYRAKRLRVEFPGVQNAPGPPPGEGQTEKE